MDYDDNFNKAFQEHDLLESQSMNSGKSKNFLQKGDSHCHSVKRKFNNVWTDGKFRKMVTVKMYSTPYSGARIRDAITGEHYKYIVGSYEQSLFFKVVMATGEFKNGPLHLYYASPEQYEIHQVCKLDKNVREKWYDSFEKARHRLHV